jgi:hypothetical protein
MEGAFPRALVLRFVMLKITNGVQRGIPDDETSES